MKSKKLSALFKQQRKNLNLSQRECAEGADVHPAQYGQWEREDILPRNPKKRARLLNALDLTEKEVTTVLVGENSAPQTKKKRGRKKQRMTPAISETQTTTEARGNIMPLVKMVAESGAKFISADNLHTLTLLQDVLGCVPSPELVAEGIRILNGK